MASFILSALSCYSILNLLVTDIFEIQRDPGMKAISLFEGIIVLFFQNSPFIVKQYLLTEVMSSCSPVRNVLLLAELLCSSEPLSLQLLVV